MHNLHLGVLRPQRGRVCASRRDGSFRVASVCGAQKTQAQQTDDCMRHTRTASQNRRVPRVAAALLPREQSSGSPDWRANDRRHTARRNAAELAVALAPPAPCARAQRAARWRSCSLGQNSVHLRHLLVDVSLNVLQCAAPKHRTRKRAEAHVRRRSVASGSAKASARPQRARAHAHNKTHEHKQRTASLY